MVEQPTSYSSLSPMLASTLKFTCESRSRGSDLLLVLAAAASIGDRLPAARVGCMIGLIAENLLGLS